MKGKVVEIFKSWSSYSDGVGGYDVFAPVIEYEFKGEVCAHVSTVFSKKPQFKVGDEVDIYCNPVTGSVIEKKESEGTKKLAITIIVFCVIMMVFVIVNSILNR